MLDTQIKNYFDGKTINKIVMGGLIAATGGAAIAVLNYIGALEVANPTLVSLISFGVPFLVNLVKEWMAGV